MDGEERLCLPRTKMKMMEDGAARLFLCLPAVKKMMADGEAMRAAMMVNGVVGRRQLPKLSLRDSNPSPLPSLSLKLADGMWSRCNFKPKLARTTMPADGVPSLPVTERTTMPVDGVPPSLSKSPAHLAVTDGVRLSLRL